MYSNFSKDSHLSKRLHQQWIYHCALKINPLIKDHRERSLHNEGDQLQQE